MLITEQKPIQEIMLFLDGDNNIFLVGCNGCAEGCKSGGEAQVIEMRQKLEQSGKKIVGQSVVDALCNQPLVRLSVGAHRDEINAADSLLVLCCGAGVQTIAALVSKICHPGCNTVSLGGKHSEWREGERCLECGACVLDYTGGICPITRCAKSLLNGPCGGSSNGKCEVSPDLPCAWQLIIERLTKIGRLDRLTRVIPTKDWSVSLTGGIPSTR